MFDGYSRQIYELVWAFLLGTLPRASGSSLPTGPGLEGLGSTADDVRRRVRVLDITNDAVPFEGGELEDGFTPWPLPPNPPGPAPSPGGGGGPINPGGGNPNPTLPYNPSGPGGTNHSSGINVRAEYIPPALVAPLVTVAFVLNEKRDEDTLHVPDTQFPILDRFSNQETECFWRIAAGQTFTESGDSATMSVGGRVMIGSQTYADCSVSIVIGSLTSEASDGVLARANLDGPIDGYCVRYEEASDRLTLLRLDAGIETVLLTYPGIGGYPGMRIEVSCQSDQIYVLFDGDPIDSVTDATYTSGYAGIASFGLSTSPLNEFLLTPL